MTCNPGAPGLTHTPPLFPLLAATPWEQGGRIRRKPLCARSQETWLLAMPVLSGRVITKLFTLWS